MSGEAGFLIALPLMVLAVPVAIGGAVIVGAARVGAAAGRAAIAYERQRRRDREEIRRSGIREEIGSYRNRVQSMMTEQSIKNQQLSESFERMMQENRTQFAKQAMQMDTNVEEFESEMRHSAHEMLTKIENEQTALQEGYQNVIKEQMESIQRESKEQFEQILNTIHEQKQNQDEQRNVLRKTAYQYLEEANQLLVAFEMQFEGRKYSSNALSLMKMEMQELQKQYEKENYEACLVGANALLASVRQEIVTADEKHQEFENWQKTACVLIEENLAWMESQKTLTQELYEAMETQAREQELELGLTGQEIGMDLSAFWGETAEGESVYQSMYERLKEFKQMVDVDHCDLTTKELKEICTQMAEVWRCDILKKSRTAFEAFNHALQREQLGNDVIDRMEDMGYQYKEFAYIRQKQDGTVVRTEDEDVGAELCMTFIDGYGDEILVRVGSQKGNTTSLRITDMAEELDEEIDKSRSRREMETAIYEIVQGEDYQGDISGGCVKGTEHKVVVNDENRRVKELVDGE